MDTNIEKGSMRITREQMIAEVIKARYSMDDQIAILRQKDTKPEEYKEFFAYAEEAKKKVTAEYAALEGADSGE